MMRRAPDSGCGCVVEVHSFSREERSLALPRVYKVLAASGCWTFARKRCGSQAVEYNFEIELNAVLDLYCGLVQAGLELTDLSHHALTELCVLRMHQNVMRASSLLVSVQLRMSFVEAQEETPVPGVIAELA